MYKPRAIGYSQHSPCDYGDPVENRRGDSNSRNRYQQSDMPLPFEINSFVRHIATGTKLIVIKYGRKQIECRKASDLISQWFYPYELELWKEEIIG